MAILIEEKFQVKAPLDVVWQYLLDPHKVVVCMPGAELAEVVDERTFLGNIKIKIGPITTSYKGRIQMTEVDPSAHVVSIVAEGRESGGGTAKGTMTSRLQTSPDGDTEVAVEAGVDITGRIMQFGRGMIEDVTRQLFQQFVSCARQQIEALPVGAGVTSGSAQAKVPEQAEAPGQAAAPGQAPPVREAEPIRVLPLAFRALWSAIGRIFKPSR